MYRLTLYQNHCYWYGIIIIDICADDVSELLVCWLTLYHIHRYVSWHSKSSLIYWLTLYYNDKYVVKLHYNHRFVVSKSMVCRLTFCFGLFLGVAYRMDKLRGNCSVTPIAGSDFDAHSLDATTVRIRTAKEFFYFDKTQYAYEGVVSMFIV